MPKSWENAKRLDGHCVVHPNTHSNNHYHTRLLTEQEKRWYLNNKWTVSQFCQRAGHTPTTGNPDQEWVYLDD